MAKVFFFNLILLLALLFLLIATPALINLVKLDIKNKEPLRSTLPNYAGNSWARQHYLEIKKLDGEYFDFIGWRRKPFQGATITIDTEGYRSHGTDLSDADAWFFGGSTMWGWGVNDENTIPALFEKITDIDSFNFGESAYTAHQSLNLFQKMLSSGLTPKYVFFYDGVNDVANKCRSELGYFSTSRERKFKERIDTEKYSFKYLFLPVLEGIRDILPRERSRNYDCDTNPKKARQIALALYYDWTIAQKAAEQVGAKFVVVLQPVAYKGAPNLSYLPKVVSDEVLARQYEVVYEEILKIMNGKKVRYLDLTKSFDGNELFYVDYCHVSPNGNSKIANEMAKELSL